MTPKQRIKILKNSNIPESEKELRIQRNLVLIERFNKKNQKNRKINNNNVKKPQPIMTKITSNKQLSNIDKKSLTKIRPTFGPKCQADKNQILCNKPENQDLCFFQHWKNNICCQFCQNFQVTDEIRTKYGSNSFLILDDHDEPTVIDKSKSELKIRSLTEIRQVEVNESQEELKPEETNGPEKETSDDVYDYQNDEANLSEKRKSYSIKIRSIATGGKKMNLDHSHNKNSHINALDMASSLNKNG